MEKNQETSFEAISLHKLQFLKIIKNTWRPLFSHAKSLKKYCGQFWAQNRPKSLLFGIYAFRYSSFFQVKSKSHPNSQLVFFVKFYFISVLLL